ncbi:MAG: hypothetical protein QXR44_02015 [Thermoproteota archaeon]
MVSSSRRPWETYETQALRLQAGVMVFIPSPAISRALGCEPIRMSYDEYEAFYLTYYEKLNQEEAAKKSF